MRDRFFADAGLFGAAAAAVAAVADEARGDALRRHKAGHYGEITACNGMSVKLFAQTAFRSNRACEDNQAARLLVEPMHDAQTRQRPFEDTAFALTDQFGYEIFQRRRERLAPLCPRTFGGMANGGDAGGFLDNDEMLIQMTDDDSLLLARF